MWTKVFWKATADRAFRSFCQGMLLVLGISPLPTASEALAAIDVTAYQSLEYWTGALTVSAMYALLAVLWAVTNSAVTEDNRIATTHAEVLNVDEGTGRHRAINNNTQQ